MTRGVDDVAIVMEFGVALGRLVPGPAFLVCHLVDAPFGQPDVAHPDVLRVAPLVVGA